jgi:hypothetical protein
MLTTLLLTFSTALIRTSSGTGIMPLYWRVAGKLTGYSRIQSHSLNKSRKDDLKCHEMMLWNAMLILQLEKTYNCIRATDNAGNKASTQRLLTKSCNKELADSKHQ